MKVRYNIFFLLYFLLLFPGFSYAAISLPWSTTFDYGPCSQRGAGGEISCALVEKDGIMWNWGGDVTSNPYTHVTRDANYPGGGGGNGLRQWKGSGSDNKNTAPVRVDFPAPQKQVWLRWYQRYEKGFQWKLGISSGTKEMYFRSGDISPGSPYIGYGYGGKYRISNQGTGSAHTNYHGSKGWDDDYPGGVSDGSWNCYEIYMKMDTGGNDGKARIWRNGELIGSWDNIHFSNNDARALSGFRYFIFPSNQKDPGLSRYYYLDIDDIAIYTGAIPPNVDGHGNSFIGPLGQADQSPLPIPKNLKVIK
jgi:hypothetical protein